MIQENFLYMCEQCQTSRINKEKLSTEVKKSMPIFSAHTDNETDNGLKGIFAQTQREAMPDVAVQV